MKPSKFKNPRTGEVFVSAKTTPNSKIINGEKFLLLAKETTTRFFWMKESSLHQI